MSDGEGGERDWPTISRRKFMAATGTAVGSASVAAGALSEDGDNHLVGGDMAIDETHRVKGTNIWYGPAAGMQNVEPKVERKYETSDWGVDFHGAGDHWEPVGEGSEEHPAPPSYFESIDTEVLGNTHFVAADEGAATVQTRYDEAVEDGADALYVYGEAVDWSSTIYVEGATDFVMQDNLDITVSDDGSNLDTMTISANGETSEWKTLITNRGISDETANQNVRIEGGNFDFSGSKDESFSWAGVWLHKCEDSEIENVTVTDVIQNPENRDPQRQYGIQLSDCTDCVVRDSEGHRCGYEGIALRGNNDGCEAVDCEANGNTQQQIQMAMFLPNHNYGAPSDCEIRRCKTDDNSITIHVDETVGSDRGVDNRIIDCDAPTVSLLEAGKRTQVKGGEIGNIWIGDVGKSTTQTVNVSGVTFVESEKMGAAISLGFDEGGIDELNVRGCVSRKNRLVNIENSTSSSTIGEIRVDGCIQYGTTSFIKNSGEALPANTEIRNSHAPNGVTYWAGASHADDAFERVVLTGSSGEITGGIGVQAATPIVYDNMEYVMVQSTPPANPVEGDKYLDDGSNRGDGAIGERMYVNGSWTDL